MHYQQVASFGRWCLIAALSPWLIQSAEANSAITYQGQLFLDGAPVNDSVDLRFRLFDGVIEGSQIGPEYEVLDIDVQDGLVTTQVNFGSNAFGSTPRWLEIDVRSPTGTGDYVTLSERQELTGVPLAHYALGPWQKSGSDLVYLNGRIGIGALNPISPLSVKGPTDDLAEFVSPSSTGARIRLAAAGTGGRDYDFISSADGNASGGGRLMIVDGATAESRLTVDANGQVGIGTTVPDCRLTVSAADQFAGRFVSGDTVGTRLRIASTATGGRTYDLLSSANGNTNGGGKLLFVDPATAPRMAIDSSGFVGIGTVTPSARLSVAGGIHADGTSGTHTQGAHLEWNKSGFSGETWLLNQKGLGVGGLRFGEVDTANVVTERMRITQTGNVGIGSTNPGFRLTVDAADQYAAGFASPDPVGTRVRMSSTATGGRTYDMVSSADGNSNGGGKWILADGALGARMVVDSTGQVGVGDSEPDRKLDVAGIVRAQSPNGGLEVADPTTGTGWRWSTINDGATLRLLELATGFVRMSITGSTIGINRAATANSLEVEGNASKSAAGSWLANSDARIKTNVETVQNALEVLSRVRLVSFEYEDQYKKEHPSVGDRRHLNVIAQEFAVVFPDYVQASGEKLPNGEDILQVDTYPLTIYTAAGVQELHGRLRDLEDANASLTADNAELRARLERLESLLAR